MDQDGRCNFASIRNLAHRARMSEDACARAVAVLESPDPDSADPDNEGRRIERVLGGWTVLNACKYRELATCEQVRQSHRERQQRYRDRQRDEVTQCNADVTPRDASVTVSDASVTQSEAEASADAEAKVKDIPAASPLVQVKIALAGPVYDVYPRHEGKAVALKAITKQIRKLSVQGWVEYPDRYGQITRQHLENEVQAAAFLQESAQEFARSPAGHAGKYVPHPSTWFNEERFTDDRQEWYHDEQSRNGVGNQATRPANATVARTVNNIHAAETALQILRDRRAEAGRDSGGPDQTRGAGKCH